MQRVKWSQLDDATKTDIIDQIFAHVPWVEENYSRSGFVYELDETTDEPIFTIQYMSVDVMYNQMRRTHVQYDDHVNNLVDILRSGRELDPIMVVNGKFYDGGHRVAAYKKYGMSYIPTIEIGFLLDLDWERWFAGEIDMNENFSLGISMQLTNILTELKLVEAKSISKKAGFEYFFIQEIEDGDAILNTEDLADKSSISILLCTEKNFQKEKITKKDAYSVKTSDLFKYMERTIPDFKKDDYVDFTGGYSLSALVGNYIQDEFGFTWCRSYADLQRVVDIDYEDNRNDVVRDRI